jgi:DNA (cytosine-5)-methyltransferase 1
VTAYYNEIDPFAAAWLRELIADGLIADGEVDERSVVDVRASDLRGYSQHHFFAGIGGWSCALRLAGWSDDRPVWTGSVPCQPLSSAGQRKGHADERHLWPAFHGLIAECRPPTLFGEQVASKLGREWFSGVRADLESSGYACGAADLCAAGVGAPHIRQRLWWVADAHGAGTGRDAGTVPRPEAQGGGKRVTNGDLVNGPEYGGLEGGLGHAHGTGCQARDTQPIGDESRAGKSSEPGSHDGLADSSNEGLPPPEFEKLRAARGKEQGGTVKQHGCAWWGKYIPCSDGKARRVEPGIQPLAHGVSNRVGTLRGAGNAIVPQVAAEFVKAFMSVGGSGGDCTHEPPDPTLDEKFIEPGSSRH